jgi:hypothetical protein
MLDRKSVGKEEISTKELYTDFYYLPALLFVSAQLILRHVDKFVVPSYVCGHVVDIDIAFSFNWVQRRKQIVDNNENLPKIVIESLIYDIYCNSNCNQQQKNF